MEFYRIADDAEYLEILNFDDEAAAACGSRGEHLNIAAHERWWGTFARHPPPRKPPGNAIAGGRLPTAASSGRHSRQAWVDEFRAKTKLTRTRVPSSCCPRRCGSARATSPVGSSILSAAAVWSKKSSFHAPLSHKAQ